jgi:DNA-binding CsgD family transcriptional regulator
MITASCDTETSPLHITPMERTALQLLASGTPNQEIARCLRISEHEVEDHLLALFERMGAASRVDAVAAAERRGLVATTT